MNRLAILLLLLSVPLLGGCSGGKSNEATVNGSVTLDGEPLKEGTIGFFPVDGKSRTTGAKIREGKFTAAVAIGAAKVEIRASKVVGQQKMYDTPNSEMRQILREILPAKYNNETELLVDVDPGTNEKNFDLKTK